VIIWHKDGKEGKIMSMQWTCGIFFFYQTVLMLKVWISCDWCNVSQTC